MIWAGHITGDDASLPENKAGKPAFSAPNHNPNLNLNLLPK
jgi:hypothetical protein